MRLDLPLDADLAAFVRGAAAAESIVVVVDGGGDQLALAVARAVLAPLAIEAAPRRINVVLRWPGAESADVDAAVAFLEGASSTTGQLIEVSSGAALGGGHTAPALR